MGLWFFKVKGYGLARLELGLNAQKKGAFSNATCSFER